MENTSIRKDLLLNPFFIIGITLLFINDFFLKWEFHNTLTGKISDFAGLFVFPMFLAFVFPKSSRTVCLFVGIGFIIWKTPYVTPFIQYLNEVLSENITRVVDYTDYFALIILPLSHRIINSYEIIKVPDVGFKYSIRVAICSFAIFTFCATTVPFREIPQGTILIDKTYSLRMPKDSVIQQIRNLGTNVIFCPDSNGRNQDRYQVESIKLVNKYYGVYDTLTKVNLEILDVGPRLTKVKIINITISEEGNIQNWKYLKLLTKQYNKLLKENLIEEIKD